MLLNGEGIICWLTYILKVMDTDRENIICRMVLKREQRESEMSMISKTNVIRLEKHDGLVITSLLDFLNAGIIKR